MSLILVSERSSLKSALIARQSEVLLHQKQALQNQDKQLAERGEMIIQLMDLTGKVVQATPRVSDADLSAAAWELAQIQSHFERQLEADGLREE